MRAFRTLLLASTLLSGAAAVAPAAAVAAELKPICNTSGSWWGNLWENFKWNMSGGPGTGYICDGTHEHAYTVE